MKDKMISSNKITKIPIRELFANPYNFFAFGFGSGLIWLAPGTCGSLVAMPFLPLFNLLPSVLHLTILLIAFMLGVHICSRAAISLNPPDHPAIVWDEIVGLWIAFFAIPFNWNLLIIGFILFRLLDIFKPWPIRTIENRFGGGLGIMLDDILAAIIVNIILHCLVLYLPDLSII